MARLKLSLAERLWQRVDIKSETECWIWRGCLDTKGYGALRYKGKLMQTHRISLEVSGRPSPAAPFNHALHGEGCISRACCNPSHLRWGSNKENSADRMKFGRHNSGERHGSAKLSASDVVIIRQSGEPASAIAKKFGVTPGTINNIRGGFTWRHLS